MLNVTPIPVLADNYTWLLHSPQSTHAAVVDPGESEPVRRALEGFGLTLTAILLTHHHHDHVGGVGNLSQPGMPVFGPAGGQTPGVTEPVAEGDPVFLPGLDTRLTVMAVPGHTLDHIAYIGDEALFAGDALFAGGCGRMFEGDAATMQGYLARLRELADETRLYCGHEYTLANLEFAIAAEPDNEKLQQRLDKVREQRARQAVTLPSTLGEEKATNPFLRWDNPEVIDQASRQAGHALEDDVAVFAALRQWKDHF